MELWWLKKNKVDRPGSQVDNLSFLICLHYLAISPNPTNPKPKTGIDKHWRGNTSSC